jgi:hypothetical protein
VIRKLAVLVVMLSGLTACALPTLYRPATDGYGYSQQQIEGNRFRVSFSGNSITERETVENYLLYRAAELTLEHGADHFVIVNRDTEARTEYDGGFGGFGGYGGFGYGSWGHRHSFIGAGTGRAITEYRAYADIVVYKGPKSPTEPNAYDARDVMARLAPTIVRPAPPKAG